MSAHHLRKFRLQPLLIKKGYRKIGQSVLVLGLAFTNTYSFAYQEQSLLLG
jgi:hypothetical protein